ncbi:hypothetical protein QUF74_06245 [Candidatus Halobeggiatoa sp. HSG11]|nr:hypothetical protein [Candidatus Halobeggiatoa sp. HSG11]
MYNDDAYAIGKISKEYPEWDSSEFSFNMDHSYIKQEFDIFIYFN